MSVIRQKFIVVVALAHMAAFPGCGGGGGTGNVSAVAASSPSKILYWVPPSNYSDMTPLDPVADLDAFEVYIRTDGDFSPGDSAMAAVSASDPNTGTITTRFDLAGLRPFLSDGVTYRVAVRAVAKNGLKSDFSGSAVFSF